MPSMKLVSSISASLRYRKSKRNYEWKMSRPTQTLWGESDAKGGGSNKTSRAQELEIIGIIRHLSETETDF